MSSVRLYASTPPAPVPGSQMCSATPCFLQECWGFELRSSGLHGRYFTMCAWPWVCFRMRVFWEDSSWLSNQPRFIGSSKFLFWAPRCLPWSFWSSLRKASLILIYKSRLCRVGSWRRYKQESTVELMILNSPTSFHAASMITSFLQVQHLGALAHLTVHTLSLRDLVYLFLSGWGKDTRKELPLGPSSFEGDSPSVYHVPFHCVKRMALLSSWALKVSSGQRLLFFPDRKLSSPSCPPSPPRLPGNMYTFERVCSLSYKYLQGIRKMKSDKDKKPTSHAAAYNLRVKIFIKEKHRQRGSCKRCELKPPQVVLI